MLGRVSSLDFFVSLVFMPVSMAIAAARMPQDELANPLGTPADPTPEPESEALADLQVAAAVGA
jgi:hypothetical protein